MSSHLKLVTPQSQDFISAYLSYSSKGEVPSIFHRWSIMTSIGAFLGRQFYFPGQFDTFPTMYIMLIGSPGTRKSTAIKLAKGLILDSGYDNIAADKTSKEKFLLDLSGDKTNEPEYGYGRGRNSKSDKSIDDFLETNLWGEDGGESLPDREVFIMADELNDFMGNGNIEFISLLGSLWDSIPVYKSRIKSGKSISIKNPTVSILAGNTPTGFALAFPSEIIGQGFFSRILLIYGEPNGRKIAFPQKPDPEATASITQYLRLIKSNVLGPATITSSASSLFERIYTTAAPIDDNRFENYSTRRFTHLKKLALICAASRVSTEINEGDVIYANTILSAAEHNMPKALGEFGRSKFSDVSHKVVQVIESSDRPLTMKDLMVYVGIDIDKPSDLATILQSLQMSDRIQQTNGGFLARRKLLREIDPETIDYSLLTAEERRGLNL